MSAGLGPRTRPSPWKLGVSLGALLLAAATLLGARSSVSASPASRLSTSPIQHIVIIYQENHSFNELLGKLCLDEGNRCVATDVGQISTGEQVPLKPEPDIPPDAGHTNRAQVVAMNGGRMNGWDLEPSINDGFKGHGCKPDEDYPCMVQAQPGAVPNLWSLADTYALSDRTFETGPVPSWGSHLDLVSANLDGFLGDQPVGDDGAGDGCDSGADAAWSPDLFGKVIMVPSCIPDKLGNGPYRPSPVQYVPTIMDRFEEAGLSWSIYAPGRGGGGYGWSICPTFYECIGSDQATHVSTPRKFEKAAAKGKLSNLSILIPYYNDSQHNGYSLIQGDNWIARNVDAIMKGPDWSSTAIFITYDDCGCFYDPVRPTPGWGIRVPMVLVSPYAKPHFVDDNAATFASMLAFAEHVFELEPLSTVDAGAYDYADAFDFGQRPLAGIPLPQHRVPRSSIEYIAKHPPDLTDPT